MKTFKPFKPVRVAVVNVTVDYIELETEANEVTPSVRYFLSGEHAQECCELHYLDFPSATEALQNASFILDPEGKFFERVPGYGIRLITVADHPIPIPGYASNNGNYSESIELTLWRHNRGARSGDYITAIASWDVTECQSDDSDDLHDY